MIKAIEIEKFGSYQNFNWQKDIGNYNSDSKARFSEINLIYGRNYSGKTTLSRLVNCLDNKILDSDYLNSKFKLILDDGGIIESNDLKNKYNVKVYNSDFVKEKLKWFYDKTCTIKPFTILGEENIGIQEEIKTMQQDLGELLKKDEELKKEYENQKRKKKNLEDILSKDLTDEARDIKNETEIYKEVNYNKRNLESSFSDFKEPLKCLSFDEKIKLSTLIKESIKNNIKKLDKLKILEDSEIISIKKLLVAKIKINKPIQELLNNSYLENWVREGKKLQNGRKKCAFCGGILTDEIWDKINQHFNNESEKLIESLENFSVKINNLKERLENYRIIDSNIVYSAFSNDLKIKIREFNENKLKLIENYDTIFNGIEDKKKNIAQNILLNLDKVEINNTIIDINVIIEKHNRYCSDISSKKDEARKKLLIDKEKDIFLKINYKSKKEQITKITSEIKLKEDEQNDLDKKLNKKTEEIKELKISLKDETNAAILINQYLNEYFGRNDLELKVNKDVNEDPIFAVYRDNELANNLSEGETSLISFCYFLTTLNDYKDDKELILWIDDPISSLDNNQIFFTFGVLDMIISEYNYNQLFVSTHNLDFFKYLKRIKNPKKKNISYFIIEREMNKTKKTSKLKKMPKFLKEYITEFHYLFNEIYKIANSPNEQLNNTYNQFYNASNNIRKFLEYYLFYRYPNNKNPLANLEKIFEKKESRSINRLINENSHLTFIDRGWKPLSIPEVKQVAEMVLKRIEKKDKEQYEALLIATENIRE